MNKLELTEEGAKEKLDALQAKINPGKDGYEFLKMINAVHPGLFGVYQDLDIAFKRALIDNKINEIETIIEKGSAELETDNPYQLAYYINMKLELIQKINDYRERLEYFKDNQDIGRCVTNLNQTEKQLLGDLYELAVKFNMLNNRESKYDAIVKNAGFKTLNDFDNVNDVKSEPTDPIENKKLESTKSVTEQSDTKSLLKNDNVSIQSGGRIRRRKLSKASRKRSKHSRNPKIIGF